MKNTLNAIEAKELASTLPQDMILELAAKYLANGLIERGEELTSLEKARHFVRTLLFSKERETFVVLFLDTKHRLIEYKALFEGTIDRASVYPREIVKHAMVLNAKAIIIAHNHPSGCAKESLADRQITQQICDVMSLVDVSVLDHLIIGCQSEEILSFAERGWL